MMEKEIGVSRNEELKMLWENKSKAYNSMFDYLKKVGLKEKDLNKFSRLLREYLQLI